MNKNNEKYIRLEDAIVMAIAAMDGVLGSMDIPTLDLHKSRLEAAWLLFEKELDEDGSPKEYPSGNLGKVLSEARQRFQKTTLDTDPE